MLAGKAFLGALATRFCLLWCMLGTSTAWAQNAAGPAAPAVSLPPVVVAAPKLAVEQQIDRTVYNVTTDLQSSFGTATDLLTAIPSVDVDGDGVVSLRGDSHVLILIDGKPSALFSGASAGDNLQSIPAKDIERIEVMPNPPPQYRAEGAAGVINIIMRKRRSRGVSGSVQTGVGSSGRYEAGINASYGAGPLTGSLSTTFRQDLRHRLTSSALIAPDPVSGVLIDSRSSMDEAIHRLILPVALSLDYALNNRQSVGVDLSRNGHDGPRTYTELNGTSASSGAVTGSSERLSSGHDRDVGYDGKLRFSQKLTSAGEILDLLFHRATSREDERYDYTNDSFVPPAATFYDNLRFHENYAYTGADADYTLPFSGAGSLKLGYAFEHYNYGYGAGGATVDPVTGAQTPEPALTDDFRYRQTIHAVYASYQASVGAFEWLAGARAELTETQGQQLTLGTSTEYRYLRLYPSLHVDWRLDEQRTLRFGASRRVSRPIPINFDPYVNYEYTPNLTSGNAFLRPQFTQSYEIGYGYDLHQSSYSLNGYYRLNTDSVTDLTENLGNGVSLTTKVNLPRNDSGGVEFMASTHVLRALTASLSGNLFYSQIDATALGSPGLKSTVGLNGKLKLEYRPTAADSAQIVLSRTDKRLTPQGYVSAVNIVNIGYKRQITPKLKAVVTFSDIFNGQRFQRFAVTPAFTEEYERTVLGRVLWAGMVYAFTAAAEERESTFGDEQTPGN